MGLDVKLADSNKPAFPTLYGPSSPVVLRCHFCDEDGHTIITTAKGNRIIPYYVCKKFCELSAANRFLQLQAKNLCTSCLYPGAPKGPPHRCYFLQLVAPFLLFLNQVSPPSHPFHPRILLPRESGPLPLCHWQWEAACGLWRLGNEEFLHLLAPWAS